MKTLTLDQYALLLEYAAEAKSDRTAEAVARECRDMDDGVVKLAVLDILAVQLGVIS